MRVFMLLDADGTSVRGFYAEDLFGPYPNDAYPAEVVEITLDQWQDFRNHQGFRVWDPKGKAFVATSPPTAGANTPYLTGCDVIDGLSPAQAKVPDVDPRDLVRIQTAPMASMVKSKIARVAKANGTTVDALLAQATPTGGS